MRYPLISVIILNWNGKEFIKTCLDSVFKTKYPNYEVIVVDNGSTDGSVEFIKSKYSKVKLIRNRKNLGYAKGNNIGIKSSKGKYLVALSNDTKVDPNWLKELVRVAESDNSIGICASKQLYFDRPCIINSTGIVVFKDGTARNRGLGEKDEGRYDKIEEVFGAPGASTFFRREMLNKIGLFDSDYFSYQEEFDLAWRARLCGWKCVYVPNALVYHRVGATSRRYPNIAAYYMHRNRLWTIVKNFSLSSIVIYLPYIFLYELGSILYSLLTQNFIHVKAIFDALKGIPKILKKRKKIQKMRTVPESEITKYMLTPPFLNIISRILKGEKVGG